MKSTAIKRNLLGFWCKPKVTDVSQTELMATETATAADMEQTHGISIQIDQVVGDTLKLDQSVEATMINIYQNTDNTTASTSSTSTSNVATTTTSNAETKPTKEVSSTMQEQQQQQQQRMSPKASTTMVIDINCNSDKNTAVVVVADEPTTAAAAICANLNDHYENNNQVNVDVQQEIAKENEKKETGYSTTISKVMKTTTTFLEVGSSSIGSESDTLSTTSNGSGIVGSISNGAVGTSERGKAATDEVEYVVGKLPASVSSININMNKNVDDNSSCCVENVASVSVTHDEQVYEQQSNGIGDENNEGTSSGSSSKTMIIQCNNDCDYDEHAEQAVHAQQQVITAEEAVVSNNDDDDDQTKCNEESKCNSVSSGAIANADIIVVGQQHSLDCMSIKSNGQQQEQQQEEQQQPPLESVFTANRLDSLTPIADCASAFNESVNYAEQQDNDTETHVVKILIKRMENLAAENKLKQVTVVKLNEVSEAVPQPKSQSLPITTNTETDSVAKTNLRLNIVDTTMVQKPISCGGVVGASNANAVQNLQNTLQNGSGNISSGSTTVTELNVSNPSYLYYMMSSGQFSPCETLDSGTCSDLESNGNNTNTSSPNIVAVNGVGGGVITANSNAMAPKLEMHLKTTKIRVNNPSTNSMDQQQQQQQQHQRAGSLTDSEESEASSLSCDSLHSTEFMRQSSVSPTNKTNSSSNNEEPTKMLGILLPDSLLRDIRDRKFPTNDFETKYGNGGGGCGGGGIGGGCVKNQNQNNNNQVRAFNHKEFNNETEDNVAASKLKFMQERNSNNAASATIAQRASLPNKTFTLNAENGTFVDNKMNSMPRKYEADKYYEFHVREHENFRSFGNGSNSANNNNNNECHADDTEDSLSEYDTKIINDDAFAGYKDILCGSATSTIRSSKGTVRGVKNRVRNGINTFLLLHQQPNVKNYIEKEAGKVVLYTTSMGIVRGTYARCSNTKQILRTLLVKFEERDVFMSIEYQQEIKERMESSTINVPQLFVEGQYIGDAETVERLNESGELRKLLKPYKCIACPIPCQTCGGYRLLPCPACNGSKKSVHRNHFTLEFVALKCMNCDEVGLVRCHDC